MKEAESRKKTLHGIVKKPYRAQISPWIKLLRTPDHRHKDTGGHQFDERRSLRIRQYPASVSPIALDAKLAGSVHHPITKCLPMTPKQLAARHKIKPVLVSNDAYILGVSGQQYKSHKNGNVR